MPLTAEQRQQAQDWLADNTAHRECPKCFQDQWKIADWLLAPTVLEGPVGGDTMHLLPVICSNCAYTEFYSAGLVGLT